MYLDCAETKTKLRQRFIASRNDYSVKARLNHSTQICDVISRWDRISDFHKAFIFLSIESEPSIENLAKLIPKLIFGAPFISGKRQMIFLKWRPEDFVKNNRWNIREPLPECAATLQPDAKTVAFVPALAIDRQGNRLGYGGGYYDTFLAKYPCITLVGTVFKEFVVNELPVDTWDIPMQYIATELEIREVNHIRKQKILHYKI